MMIAMMIVMVTDFDARKFPGNAVEPDDADDDYCDTMTKPLIQKVS